MKASTYTVRVLSGGCGGLFTLGAQHKPLKQAPSRIKTATHQPGGACCSLWSLLALRVRGRAEVKVQTNTFTSAPLAKERKGSVGLSPQALRRPSHPRLGLPTRDQTHAVGVEVQCLKHWIAREVPFCYIFTATFPATAIVIFWGIVFSWVDKKSSQSLSRGLAL